MTLASSEILRGEWSVRAPTRSKPSEESRTCLHVLGVQVQGVADFGDIYWFVFGHAFFLFFHVHNLLHWFLFIVGPDLQQTVDILINDFYKYKHHTLFTTFTTAGFYSTWTVHGHRTS